MFSFGPLPRIALVALATALLVFMGTGTAFAKKTKVSATLQFSPPSHFSGKVSSKSSGCKKNASVSLLYFQSSADTTADKVGQAKADKKGKYAIEVPNATAGEYEVRVSGRKVDGTSCAAFIGLRYQF